MTQEQLAGLIGTTRRSVIRWEREGVVPIRFAPQIAKALRLKLDEISEERNAPLQLLVRRLTKGLDETQDELRALSERVRVLEGRRAP